MMSRLIRATRLLILSTAVIWIAWDVFVYKMCGTICTESANTHLFGFYLPSLPLCMGALMGHFFGEFRAPTTKSYTQARFVSVLSLSIFWSAMAWLGMDIFTFEMHKHGTWLSEQVLEATHHTPMIPFQLGVLLGVIFFQMSGATVYEGEVA